MTHEDNKRQLYDRAVALLAAVRETGKVDPEEIALCERAIEDCLFHELQYPRDRSRLSTVKSVLRARWERLQALFESALLRQRGGLN